MFVDATCGHLYLSHSLPITTNVALATFTCIPSSLVEKYSEVTGNKMGCQIGSAHHDPFLFECLLLLSIYILTYF